MITIKIEIATNGVIKTIIDDNYNGANELNEWKTVYDTDGDSQKGFNNTIQFLSDLSDDLGIDLGNKFSKEVLSFDTDWGSHYDPSIDELKERVKDLTAEIKECKKGIDFIKKDNIAKSLISSGAKK